MKKSFLIMAIAIASLSIFNACEKSDELIAPNGDEQQLEAVKADVFLDGNYLAFKNYETLDSLSRVLNNSSNDEIRNFESKMGFKSAYTHRDDLLTKVETLPEEEVRKLIESASKNGYFNPKENEFTLPFNVESYATVLNVEGKVKIGNSIYQFTENIEIISPDLKTLNLKKGETISEIRIPLDNNVEQLKSNDETLKEVLLAQSKARLRLSFKRDYIVLQDWIPTPTGLVKGDVGFEWRYYYKFHSYKRRRLYKAKRETYFNWKTKQLDLGNNMNYEHLDYYNASPATERSTEKKHIHTFIVYSAPTYTPAPGTPPAVNTVNVSDFWSDYMSATHGSLVIP
jgi:hypothetical protein